MTLTRKDVAATGFTALAVLAFMATHEGWDVWLIGDDRRWAAVAVLVLGACACSAGARIESMSGFMPALGATALILAVLAIATGSLTVLSLLVAAVVVLWALATYRHAVGSELPRTGGHPLTG